MVVNLSGIIIKYQRKIALLTTHKDSISSGLAFGGLVSIIFALVMSLVKGTNYFFLNFSWVLVVVIVSMGASIVVKNFAQE